MAWARSMQAKLHIHVSEDKDGFVVQGAEFPEIIVCGDTSEITMKKFVRAVLVYMIDDLEQIQETISKVDHMKHNAITLSKHTSFLSSMMSKIESMPNAVENGMSYNITADKTIVEFFSSYINKSIELMKVMDNSPQLETSREIIIGDNIGNV